MNIATATNIDNIFKVFLRQPFGLTTVITVLIIIVVSVTLASTVSYLAINVTNTRQVEESIILGERHVWYNPREGNSQAAILLINNGGVDIVVQKVTVRGQTVNWSKTFYYTGIFTLEPGNKITYINNIADGSFTPISDGFGSYASIKASHGNLPLKSGESMIVYVKNPDSITIGDVGLTVALDVYTMQAIYYKETNVEAALNPEEMD